MASNECPILSRGCHGENMKSELIERHRKLKTDRRDLEEALSRLRKKLDAIKERNPRVSAAERGEYVQGAVLVANFKPLPGEEEISPYFMPDEELTESEKLGQKLVSEVWDEIHAEENRLQAVQEGIQHIELQAIAEGYPVAALDTPQQDQGSDDERAPGRPKSKPVAKRRRIILKATGATTNKELGEWLNDIDLREQIFEALDAADFPLPSSKYDSDRWLALRGLELRNAVNTIRKDMHRHFNPPAKQKSPGHN